MRHCIFSKIITRQAPAHIIYEDELFLAFLDIDPISWGYTLVIPKQDILDIHSLDEKTGGQIMHVAKSIA